MITPDPAAHEGHIPPFRALDIPLLGGHLGRQLSLRSAFVNLSRYVIIASLGAAVACASSGASAGSAGSVGAPAPKSSQDQIALGPHGDSRLLTEADIAATTQSNVYDLVQALRPRWLQITSVGIQGRQAYTITAFLDDTKLGEPETLRTPSVGGIRAIRYYDASASQQKFPNRGLGPVIQVIRK